MTQSPSPLARGEHRASRGWGVATVFARLALAVAFLSALADRFGWWGEPGTRNVAWGTFESFVEYTHVLAPYSPRAFVEPLAWGATALEGILAVALILGVALRPSSVISFGLLVVFGASMALFTGPQAPLNASVFAAAAASLLLALAPPGSYVLSADQRLHSR